MRAVGHQLGNFEGVHVQFSFLSAGDNGEQGCDEGRRTRGDDGPVQPLQLRQDCVHASNELRFLEVALLEVADAFVQPLEVLNMSNMLIAAGHSFSLL